MLRGVYIFSLCGLVVCVAMLCACQQATPVTNAAGADQVSAPNGSTSTATVSDGRKNAARIIRAGTLFRVALLQMDPAVPIPQHPCLPLGGPGFARWPSRLPGGVAGFLVGATDVSEYDSLHLSATGDTDYVFSVRAGTASASPPAPGDPNPHFSQLEFNFRAVNPFQVPHAWGDPHYDMHEADYPSNDADDPGAGGAGDPANVRSLINLNGGPVAIVVNGIDFSNPPASTPTATTAWMNGLGPLGWVAFMRDNSYQSGRFFAIWGAMTGGPVALADTLTPLDDGIFESVQVRGDVFDTLSENPHSLTAPPPACDVCPALPGGVPTPGRPYALFDYSNLSNGVAPVDAPGLGGFVFVVRPEAFMPAPLPDFAVVVDPSANPGQLATAHFGNLLVGLPQSGYPEDALDTAGIIDHPGAIEGPYADGGVHELSISVFFMHNMPEEH
ncbi:MAG TPA: hypothetical protein VMV94_00865 [Phycisphaerae bacterium]|nr:hypothetical protein [Phycisphaerae bacterium]